MNAARDQSATGIIGKMTDTRKRVKLYELNADRQWDDKGTGEIVFLNSCVVHLPNFVRGNNLTSLLKNLYCCFVAFAFVAFSIVDKIKINKNLPPSGSGSASANQILNTKPEEE